ncbi:hypothetical protein C0Q70_11731 [Pomacea canaliculata]|uniref:Uncharacterized protein n=2 Tax=Pomacea canaliculata TaxID=400727 RepID=A0A2T7P6T2_POMCA|nr:hypothetical protein C0Q70_11731 [Pomacea canaliculata]
MIRVEFELRGKSDGFVDASMGSTLRINFHKMSGTVTVSPSYTGKSQTTTTLSQHRVTSGENVVTVDFPDFTWREGSGNIILLEFGDVMVNSLTLVDIQLERRPMTGEKVQTVHKSDKMIMDAIDVDFWWREPESMRVVNGESGQMWEGVDYFRVSLPVPWNGGFAQVFVMYQDGNARLLPLAPPGVDWIPFGSSVLIGQNDPTQLRPSAPISMVTFHPSSLRFNISYRDGGSAVVKLSVGMAHTEVTVYEIKDARPDPSRPRPFATLRSMYLEDGNSDCDSVLVNGQKYFPILGSWEEVAGNSFVFFRRCESKHLTLSPDIKIDVKKTDL